MENTILLMLILLVLVFIAALDLVQFLSQRPPRSGAAEKVPAEDREKEAPPPITMQEGFENLMSYRVSLGHDKTTGGGV